ncbi:Protein disulfide-isomerase 2-3, partial [Cymbomonas tetramitiformis]
VALSPKKMRFAKHTGVFETAGLKRFVDGVISGFVRTVESSDLPKVVDTVPWDGGDGEQIVEEEFDLADLMAD